MDQSKISNFETKHIQKKKESNINNIRNIELSEIIRIICRPDLYNLQTKKQLNKNLLIEFGQHKNSSTYTVHFRNFLNLRSSKIGFIS